MRALIESNSPKIMMVVLQEISSARVANGRKSANLGLLEEKL
jgi:hypothetical protein